MSLSLFRDQLRAAVREAQDQEADPTPIAAPIEPRLEVLRKVARGELSAERALAELEARL